MALGCLPICGDLPSIREWITPGENGLLIDPSDPQVLADAILKALRSPDLIASAARVNRAILNERANIVQVRQKVEDFFREVAQAGIK